MTATKRRYRARTYPNICKCGAHLVYIDTPWGRTAFEEEPRMVILSPIGRHWVCVPPLGRLVRAIIETGMLVGDTLAYIPHFYFCKERSKRRK